MSIIVPILAFALALASLAVVFTGTPSLRRARTGTILAGTAAAMIAAHWIVRLLS